MLEAQRRHTWQRGAASDERKENMRRLPPPPQPLYSAMQPAFASRYFRERRELA